MEITLQLLEKYFNGQCTEAEKEWVEIALLKNDDPVFDRFFAEMAQRSPVPGGVSALAKTERRRLRHFIREPRRMTTFIRYAAAIFLLMMGGLFFLISKKQSLSYKPAEHEWVMLRNPSSTEVQRLQLTDSSVVYLNGNARLYYDRKQFNRSRREVRLEGEAYFEIAHNAAKPFIVYTRDISTTVKGTKFNIEAYKNEEEVHVTLLEGKVAVQEQNKQIEMRPDQRLTIDRNMNFHLKETGASVYNDWIENGEIFFDNLPLKTALNRVSVLYNISIKTDEKLLNDKYVQGRFKRQDPEILLKKLLFIHHLHYKKKGPRSLIITP